MKLTVLIINFDFCYKLTTHYECLIGILINEKGLD